MPNSPGTSVGRISEHWEFDRLLVVNENWRKGCRCKNPNVERLNSQCGPAGKGNLLTLVVFHVIERVCLRGLRVRVFDGKNGFLQAGGGRPIHADFHHCKCLRVWLRGREDIEGKRKWLVIQSRSGTVCRTWLLFSATATFSACRLLTNVLCSD